MGSAKGRVGIRMLLEAVLFFFFRVADGFTGWCRMGLRQVLGCWLVLVWLPGVGANKVQTQWEGVLKPYGTP